MPCNRSNLPAALRMWLPMALAMAAAGQAHAVPSFARQTGSDCAACHVGAYGPQLTPYGIKFKLGGYVDGNGKSNVPLSAMLILENDHQKKWNTDTNQADSKSRTGMTEASVFVAGKLADHLGSFIQVTRSSGDGTSPYSNSLDQADVRLTNNVELSGQEALLGVSFNNNPTVQDPFNTLGQWSYPYTKTDRIPNYPGAELTSLSTVEGRVLGVNAYALVNNNFYGELGLYNSLSHSTQSRLGVGRVNDDGNPTSGLGNAPYWRLAYMQDLKTRAWNVGMFGFSGTLKNHPADPADPLETKFRNFGLDGSYQFLGNREHIVAVNGSWVREKTSDIANDATTKALNVATSYHYLNTYGASAGYFKGSTKKTPTGGDTTTGGNNGWVYQLDYTPFGKEDSPYAPWANLRVGLQYVRYNTSSDIDKVNGQKVGDLNSLRLFAWTSF